ncbi:hypothetical protein D3C81_1401400 [compost metagenome]
MIGGGGLLGQVTRFDARAESDFALLRRFLAQDVLEQGAFACPVVADQHGRLAIAQRVGQAAVQYAPAAGVAYLLEDDRVLAGAIRMIQLQADAFTFQYRPFEFDHTV